MIFICTLQDACGLSKAVNEPHGFTARPRPVLGMCQYDTVADAAEHNQHGVKKLGRTQPHMTPSDTLSDPHMRCPVNPELAGDRVGFLCRVGFHLKRERYIDREERPFVVPSSLSYHYTQHASQSNHRHRVSRSVFLLSAQR